MEELFISQAILSKINLPEGIFIRSFIEGDFTSIQKLYETEGWMTAVKRPEDSLKAWKNSTIALVAVEGENIVGLVRALTDGEVTTYIAELLTDRAYRGKGLGKALIDTCHSLYPHTRLDLLSTEAADEFYMSNGFKESRGFRKSYI